MTTTPNLNTPSSVPNFLDDDETEDGVETQVGTVVQPENSSEPQPQPAKSSTIGAVRTVESTEEETEFNPVLDFADEEYEGERVAPAPRKPRASIARSTRQTPVEPPAQTVSDAMVVAQPVESDAEKTAKKRKKKVNPAAPKYGRTSLRAPDYLLMALLRKCGFSTSKQIAIALNVATSTAHKRALGLKEIGMVGSDKVFGMTQLWYLTPKGSRALEFMGNFDDRISKRYYPGKGVPNKLEHTLAVNHVIAQLVGGKSELLNLAPAELPTGIDLLPFLVPEQYMNTEYSRATFDKSGVRKPVDMARDIRDRVSTRVRASGIEASDVLAVYPELWTVVNSKLHSTTTKENHPADLVIDLEHLRTDLTKPVSIGVEVELSLKQGPELEKIINSVRMNKTDLKFASLAVLAYLTPSETIAKAVKRAAKAVVGGSDTTTVVRVLELKDAAGNPFDGRAWTL